MRCWTALLLWCCVSSTAFGQSPKVRASLGETEKLYVGQRLTLNVDLLAPGYFASAPDFDLPDPPGLLLIPPTGHPVLGSETIDGGNYTVQQHELSVFARRAGPQTIPPLTIRFRYKAKPLDKDAQSAVVTTSAIAFTAIAPPGAEKLAGILSAHDLSATETWTPTPPATAKVGDAFTRTITFKATDVPAMAFPPFAAGRINGLGIYPKPPTVNDHDERGTLTGQRTDTVVYACQRAGTFTIPAVRLSWFDLDERRVKAIDMPARQLTVAPNPDMASQVHSPHDDASARPPVDWRVILVAVAGVVAIVAACAVSYRHRERLLRPFRPIHLVPLNPIYEEPGT